ncbi:MAG: hypothetical protein QT03_C0001G0061 [archaeon GW2011_AR10]|uniref:Uncharacterized protein n=1 Tax=Candidatus Iainarchaeum sp. TaxID=3101447 RepID=A0A7J4IV82_9ARCH|nr:MAG: hypothetical protein QT03_C0001G0061 [archaeon GW2011_AR10]HIH08269.1 hypothetical protein [Candidatus Diapherotrites archaeon]
MPRRSPWGKQPKAERRGLWKKFRRTPISKPALMALEFRKRGRLSKYENISMQEKIDFLLQNRHATVAALRNFAKRQANNRMLSRKASTGRLQALVQRKFLKETPEKDINYFLSATIEQILKAERRKAFSSTLSTIENYLQKRGIPVDRETVKIAFELAGKPTLEELSETGIDLRNIEREYLEIRRGDRFVFQEKNKDINRIFFRAFGHERLTPAQRRRAKNWIINNFEKFEKRRRELYKELTVDRPQQDLANLSEAVDKAETEFIQTAQQKFIQTFKPTKKVQVAVAITEKPAKVGTRAERMAAYVPREKTVEQRKQEIRQREEIAKETKRGFNVAEYCLEEISKENNQTGKTLREMMQKRLLNRDSLVSLFTSGSLTQRVFLAAVQEKGFAQQFGPRSINVLARGLAFIGPQGRKVERAKRAFQSAQAEQMFQFLEKHDLLDTGHSRGKGKGWNVYLVRI